MLFEKNINANLKLMMLIIFVYLIFSVADREKNKRNYQFLHIFDFQNQSVIDFKINFKVFYCVLDQSRCDFILFK